MSLMVGTIRLRIDWSDSAPPPCPGAGDRPHLNPLHEHASLCNDYCVAKLIFRRSRSPRPSGWTIGEAAERLQALGLQVSTSQIRKLEREGLLETPARTAGNYRVLDDASLERIRLIVGLRVLGLSVSTVRQALDLLDQRAPSEVRDAFLEFLDEKLGQRLHLLKDLHALLERYRRASPKHP